MPANIILTTCSLNHIAQAKSLGDSVLKYAPGYKLVIGLVDKLEGRVSSTYFAPHSLVEAHELQIPQFHEMVDRYTVLEINCAMKSFFTAYVLEKFKPAKFIFLDSDMLLFDSLDYIEKQLETASILLTPHITSPFPDDGLKPQEKTILKTGMFNAGFYALGNDDTSQAFVKWWTQRMVDQCYEKPVEGLNVDQKWLNFVPFYFKNVKVIEHPGCNLAYWNLHERHLEKKDGKFFVNNEALIFFHYSGYSIQHPEKVSKHQSRIQMEDNVAMKEIFSIYYELLRQNDHAALQKIPFYYKKSGPKWWRRKK